MNKPPRSLPPLSPQEYDRIMRAAKRRAHALRGEAIGTAIVSAARFLGRLRVTVRPPVSGTV